MSPDPHGLLNQQRVIFSNRVIPEPVWAPASVVNATRKSGADWRCLAPSPSSQAAQGVEDTEVLFGLGLFRVPASALPQPMHPSGIYRRRQDALRTWLQPLELLHLGATRCSKWQTIQVQHPCLIRDRAMMATQCSIRMHAAVYAETSCDVLPLGGICRSCDPQIGKAYKSAERVL